MHDRACSLNSFAVPPVTWVTDLICVFLFILVIVVFRCLCGVFASSCGVSAHPRLGRGCNQENGFDVIDQKYDRNEKKGQGGDYLLLVDLRDWLGTGRLD